MWAGVLSLSLVVCFQTVSSIPAGLVQFDIADPQETARNPQLRNVVFNDDDQTLSAVLTWEPALNETSIGGYDVMFSPSTDPADRMAYTDHVQGRWIIPKSEIGQYRVDIRFEPVPFGAKYLLIFSGFPSDFSIPAVVPLTGTTESSTPMDVSAIQKSSSLTLSPVEGATTYGNIVLPKPHTPDEVMHQVQTGAHVEKTYVDGQHFDDVVVAQSPAKHGSLDEVTLLQDEPYDYNLMKKEQDWQAKDLTIRVERMPESNHMRGLVHFEPAPNQQKGVAVYYVWWGSQCNVDSRIRDHMPENPTGVLMTFLRDNNLNPYERFFDWRPIPHHARYIMVVSADTHGVSIVTPTCFGPFNTTESSTTLAGVETTTQLTSADHSSETSSYPEGTEPISHARVSFHFIQADPDAMPAPIGAEYAHVDSEDHGKPIHVGDDTNTLLQASAVLSQPPFITTYIGYLWDHMPYEDASMYQIPWAMRSMSPSPSPVVVPSESPSPSSAPSPSPSNIPAPDAGDLVCDEADTSPRDVKFVTAGPVNGNITGVLSFRPSQLFVGQKFYQVFRAFSCRLDHIITNSEAIAEELVTDALVYTANLVNVKLLPGSRFLLVVAVNEQKLPVGIPFCVSVKGGSCPNKPETYPVMTCPQPEPVSKYSVLDAGFSSPGPSNGKLSGVITFEDRVQDPTDSARVAKYFARFSKTCSAQGVIKHHGADYPVYEWSIQPSVRTYTGVLSDVDVPTGSQYLLIFTADANGTPLAAPVGLPVTGWSSKYLRHVHLSVDDLVQTTETARFNLARRIIWTLPGMIQQNALIGKPMFEVLTVSPDDITVVSADNKFRAQLFGVPDIVTQHLIRFTGLVPYVRRSVLRDPPVEKPDYGYTLMVSTVPVVPDHDKTLMPVVTFPTPIPFNASLLLPSANSLVQSDGAQPTGDLVDDEARGGRGVGERVEGTTLVQWPSGVPDVVKTLVDSVKQWLSGNHGE